jgi:hypothetical protein
VCPVFKKVFSVRLRYLRSSVLNSVPSVPSVVVGYRPPPRVLCATGRENAALTVWAPDSSTLP